MTAAPAPLVELLPRMDIAVFAGFAASGPLNLPVAVEDAQGYAATFGPDVPLAWDTRRNEVVHGTLGPAVRAFFDNGGRRCWIVRIAREEEAAYSEFALAGVLAVSLDGEGADEPQQARLRARSPGSWCDSFRLEAAVRATPLHIDRFIPATGSLQSAEPAIAVTGDGPDDGDLLRFTWSDAEGKETSTLYALAQPGGEAGSPESRVVQLRACSWSAPFVVPGASVVAPEWHTRARWTESVEGLPASHQADAIVRVDDGETRVTLVTQTADAPVPGSIVTLSDGSSSCWYCVLAVTRLETSSDDVSVTLRLSGIARARCDPAPRSAGNLRWDRIALALRASDGSDRYWSATAGSGPGHARYIGAFAVDDEFFGTHAAPSSETLGLAAADSVNSTASERFPLSALAGESQAFIPLFLPAAAGIQIRARHDGREALERDGLARFDSSLFVDAALANTPASRLMEEADAIRYGASPRRLRGIHAALGADDSTIADEATLIAVPDAALPVWRSKEDLEFATRALAIAGQEEPCPPGGDFVQCSRCSARISDFQAAAGLRPDLGFELVWEDASWHSAEEPDAFESESGYIIDEATRGDFADAARLGATRARSFEVGARPDGDYFYRIRAERTGEKCDWAAALAVTVRSRSRYSVDAAPSGTAQALLEVQRALLRLCAGRGDFLAVLSLPEPYGAGEALAHVSKLRAISAVPGSATEVRPLAPGEEHALSYGALYHPWMMVREASDSLARLPPDGPACGLIAARTLARGAWIAPANEDFAGTLALTRALEEDGTLGLLQAGVNVVQHTPRGFLAAAADTLALVEEWRPINVRRLLILLRRVALRRGAQYVFEPNDDALRRTVERSFDTLLNDLYERGAFAGASADSAFRVSCGNEVNPPSSVERGRFFVDIKVAPALPLTFMTVRLMQSSAGLQVIESNRG